jgi:hypothetical protein
MRGIQRHIGLALGGAAGARLAQCLGLRLSGLTLLRLVHRGASAGITMRLRFIGIDDRASKRGHHYGSIICDLERRRYLESDRESALARWSKPIVRTGKVPANWKDRWHRFDKTAACRSADA